VGRERISLYVRGYRIELLNSPSLHQAIETINTVGSAEVELVARMLSAHWSDAAIEALLHCIQTHRGIDLVARTY
jgi:hypothetical protein